MATPALFAGKTCPHAARSGHSREMPMTEKNLFTETPMFKIEGDERIAIPAQLKSALDFAKTNLHCKAESVVASNGANEIQWRGRLRKIVIVLQSTTGLVSNRFVVCKAITFRGL